MLKIISPLTNSPEEVDLYVIGKGINQFIRGISQSEIRSIPGTTANFSVLVTVTPEGFDRIYGVIDAQ